MTEGDKFCCLMGIKRAPCSITASPAFCFHLYSLSLAETRSVDQVGLELIDLPASASAVLVLKLCTTTPSSKILANSFSQVGNLAEQDLALGSALTFFYLLIYLAL